MGSSFLLVNVSGRNAELLQRALEGLGVAFRAVDFVSGVSAAAENGCIPVLLAVDDDQTVRRWWKEYPASGGGPRPVLVAATVQDDAGFLEGLLTAGADDCLVLPMEPSALRLRLRAYGLRAERQCMRLAQAGVPGMERSLCPFAKDVPFGVFLSSVEGRFLDVNNVLVRMLGYSSQEELMQVRLVPDVYCRREDRERILATQGDYLENVVLDWRRRDGSPLTVRLSGRICRGPSGRIQYMEGIIQDITGQVRAESHLREAVEQLQAILNGMVDGLAIVDLKTRQLLAANAALCRMTGRTEEEILNLTVFDMHPPEEHARILEQFENHRRSPGARSRPLRCLRRDGSVFYADITSSLLTYRGRLCVMGFFRDLSEYREVSEAARTSEARFRAIFEGAALGIAVSNAEGAILQCNKALADTLGYPCEELIGRRIRDFSHPDDRGAVIAAYQRLVGGASPGPLQLEERCIDRCGRVVWCRIAVTLLPVRKGQPPLALAMFENVTRWKEAEDRVRQSEQRYRLIAENVRDVIWTSDIPARLMAAPDADGTLLKQVVEQWRYSYVSPSIRNLLGYSVEEAMALRLADLFPPESIERTTELFLAILRAMRQANARVQDTIEVEELAKDGSRRWCEVTVSVVPDPAADIVRVLGITRDITSRRQAEQALRTSESTLRNLFDNLPDLIVIVNAQGVAEFANDSAIPAEEIVGRSYAEFLHPDCFDAFKACLAQVLQTGQPQILEAQDCRNAWWVFRFVTLSEAGRADRAMLICTDITERRAAAQAILEEQRLLRQVLDLHEHDRQLISYEIHDGFAQQLTGALFHLQAYKQIREGNAHEAATLFDSGMQLLTSSINEARRLISGLRPPILDERGIVAAIDYLVCERRRDTDQAIVFQHEVDFERLPPPLEVALFRIVEELLENACQHSQSSLVRVDLTQEGERLRVRIRDWGVGFDPESIDPKCFGLRGIRERTRLLGGMFALESITGKGTTVSVEMPLVLPVS